MRSPGRQCRYLRNNTKLCDHGRIESWRVFAALSEVHLSVLASLTGRVKRTRVTLTTLADLTVTIKTDARCNYWYTNATGTLGVALVSPVPARPTR